MKVGDHVAAFSGDAGGFADLCVVAAERVIPIPDEMGLDVAAALPIQELTSWHLLHNVSVTRPGDTILVHAIGGRVGLFATQLAVKASVSTVGTRGKEKRAIAFGAAGVINRESEDFAPAAMAFTGGRGVDKIVDSTGASILDRKLRDHPQARPCCELRRGGKPSVHQSMEATGAEVAHPLPAFISAMSISLLTPGGAGSTKSSEGSWTVR